MIVIFYPCIVLYKIQRLLQRCPHAHPNGTYTIDHRQLDGIVAIGLFLSESNLQVSNTFLYNF